MSSEKDILPHCEDFSKDKYPEVFAKPPKNVTYGKPGQLSEAQVKQYFEDGFLIIEDFFDQAAIDAVKQSIADQVDCLINVLHKSGKLQYTYPELGLFKRLTSVEKDCPGANVLCNLIGFLSQAVKDIWTNEKLLNIVEQLLGTQDIQGHPVWNVRPKTPRSESGEVPWHQDIGYTDRRSHSVHQLTAWIPLLNAGLAQGCMEVLRGGHKTGRVLPHYGCWKDTHFVEIMEEEMCNILGVDLKTDAVVCEIPERGLLLFNNMIPHRSLRNTSSDIRWSIDLRWQRCDQPVAFHGLKEGVRFRSSSDPNYEIDWSPFANTETIEEAVNLLTKNGTDFSTLVPGPWIAKWPIKHENRHVMAYKDALKASGGKATTTWHKEKPTDTRQ